MPLTRQICHQIMLHVTGLGCVILYTKHKQRTKHYIWKGKMFVCQEVVILYLEPYMQLTLQNNYVRFLSKAK